MLCAGFPPNLNVGTDVPLYFTAVGGVIKPLAWRVVVYLGLRRCLVLYRQRTCNDEFEVSSQRDHIIKHGFV